MFIGHFAIGFASKSLAPRASLGWLILAPLWLDIIWPVFVLLGVERVRIAPKDTAFTPLSFEHYPWSHSLLASLFWAIMLGTIYYVLNRYARGAVLIAIGVLSHWVLDWVSHRADMPITPWSSTKLGLGLWNSILMTMLIETIMFVTGVWLYQRVTASKDRIGRYGFGLYIAFLYLSYVLNAFGTPPPHSQVVALLALLMWLLIPWAAWFDRHRQVLI